MGLTKAVRNLFAVGCCIAEVQERPQALGNDRLVQRGYVVASQAMILRCTCPAVLKVAFVGEDLLPGSRAGDLLQSCWFSYEPCTISAAPRRLCTWDAEEGSSIVEAGTHLLFKEFRR